MAVRSLDTNLILRFVLNDIPDQAERVARLIEDAKPASLAISDAVFFECAWVLAGKPYNFSRSLIGEMLLDVADLPQLNCNHFMLRRAVQLYLKYPSISFLDACLVAYAELDGTTPLLTLDEKLARALPELVALLPE